MDVVAFEPWHARVLTPQPAQRMDAQAFDEAFDAPFGDAWTAMHEGRPIACAGLVELWRGRAMAWALLAADAGRHLRPLTRVIRFHLDNARFDRIELSVDAGFGNGCQWARMLGFTLAAPSPLRKFLANGGDAWLFERVR